VPIPQHTPHLANDTVIALLNTKIVVDVLANDTDVDGNLDPSTLRITARSSSTSVSLEVEDGKVRVRVSALLLASAWFDYEVCDTTGLCATARVTITSVTL